MPNNVIRHARGPRPPRRPRSRRTAGRNRQSNPQPRHPATRAHRRPVAERPAHDRNSTRSGHAHHRRRLSRRNRSHRPHSHARAAPLRGPPHTGRDPRRNPHTRSPGRLARESHRRRSIPRRRHARHHRDPPAPPDARLDREHRAVESLQVRRRRRAAAARDLRAVHRLRSRTHQAESAHTVSRFLSGADGNDARHRAVGAVGGARGRVRIGAGRGIARRPARCRRSGSVPGADVCAERDSHPSRVSSGGLLRTTVAGAVCEGHRARAGARDQHTVLARHAARHARRRAEAARVCPSESPPSRCRSPCRCSA